MVTNNGNRRVKNAPTKAAQTTVQQKNRFLGIYKNCGIITRACTEADVGRRTFYDWLEQDPAFATAFEDAREEATDLLEEEARRRGYEGVDEPVFYQGVLVSTVRKYSDTLLIFMLKANREKFRDKVQAEVEVKKYHVVQDQ